MKGIMVPDAGEDFTADPVELFFDLAFVFGFSRLVHALVNHHTWPDVGRVGLLFMLMWLAWSQFTWSANAVPGNQRQVRVIFLIATVASVPMAAAIDTAYDTGGSVFAVALALIVLMALGLYLMNVPRDGNVFRSIRQYAAITTLALATIVIGGFLEGNARVAVWVLAVFIIFAAMALAGRGEFIVRTGHFAERHGLIIIIALGEVIVAVGTPVLGALEEGELRRATVVSLIGAGAFAALLWWAYFDRAQPALEHRAGNVSATEKGRYARDVYTLGHLPVVAGVILAAAAVEEIALHPTDPLERPFQLMLAGGLTLFLVGISLTVARAYAVLAKERAMATVLILVLVLLGGSIDGVVLLLGVDFLLFGALLAEHWRVEGARIRPLASTRA